jgi:hypothetical protein
MKKRAFTPEQIIVVIGIKPAGRRRTIVVRSAEELALQLCPHEIEEIPTLKCDLDLA